MRRLALWAMLGATGAVMAQDVDVRILTIAEHRTRIVAEGAEDNGRSPGLRLRLEFSAKNLHEVTHWGDLKFTYAKDERGTDLIASRRSVYEPLEEGLRLINRNHMWFGEDKKPKDKLKLEITVGLPQRSALKLAKLEATLSMQRSKVETTRIEATSKMAGKMLKVPAAKKLGAKIKFAQIDDNTLRFTVTGKPEVVQTIIIRDAAGADLSNGRSSMEQKTRKDLSITLDSVPAKFFVEVTVIVDKSVQIVPIRLIDIDLP